MLALLISYIIIFILCWNYGSILNAAFKINLEGLTFKLLSGLILINTVSLFLSLFIPMNAQALLCISMPALLYMLIRREHINEIITDFNTNRKTILISLPFLYFGFLLLQEPPLNYDTNMYHFQAVLWNDEYPAVPGLANIRGQLGFNNSILVCHSLFSLHKLFGQHIFALNYFIFTIGVLFFVKQVLFYITKEQFNAFGLWASALMLVGFVSRIHEISSPTPDFAANAILMVLLAYCLNNHHRDLSWIFVCVLSVYIVTIKLSMLPVMILFGFGLYKLLKNKEYKSTTYIFLFSAILMVIWCARNVIMTGWLVYPVHYVDLFDFDWKVSLGRVLSENDAIKGWARYPDFAVSIKKSAQMNFSEWFPFWWNRATLGKFYLLAAVFSSLLFIIWILLGKANKNLQLFWFGACITIGFVFWFIMAPDFRFCIGFIFHLILLPLFLFADIKSRLNLAKSTHKNLVSFTLFLFFSYSIYAKWEIVNNNVFPSWISGRWKVPKTLDYVGRQPIDSFKHLGQKYYYPKYSSVNNDTRCYDQCIPCLPYRDTAIILRGKTMGSGFRRSD